MALLSDKVAIVTGAGRGIGRAVALLLAKEGASVVVNDTGASLDGSGRDEAVAESVVTEICSLGVAAIASHVSVAERESARSLVERALEHFGQVDVMIHCAGILLDGALLRVSETDFSRMLSVQLAATLWCTQAAGEHMRTRGSGSIVVTTSAAGLLGNFGQSAYSAASAGVYGLMRCASVELQRHGVRVNAVAPLAKTRTTEKLPLFEHTETMTANHVAPAYLFLASDAARDTTGQVLSAAGGRISLFRFSEVAEGFKEADGGIWTAAEIAEHFAAIRR